VSAQVLGDGPLAQVAFSAQPVTDQKTWLASDRARSRRIMLELLRNGVFLNPMGTKLYLSLAHDEDAVAEFVGRFAEALAATAG
jgi:glutamate-1-semialdehyde 2,1-aminomutase